MDTTTRPHPSRRPRATTRLARALASAGLVAVLAAPSAALAAPLVVAAEEAPAEAPAEGEGGRRPIAETPRDQLGLVVLVALLAAGGLAVANARRQLKGERPSADGQFRWR